MNDKFKVRLLCIDRNGDPLPDYIQELYQTFIAEIVPLYNKAAEVLNPYYKEWNEKYDEAKDGSYDRYICSKMDQVLVAEGIRDVRFDARALLCGEDVPQICFVNCYGTACSIILEPIK